MTSDKRNTNVMVALLGSLTVGALLLLWLEPRPEVNRGGGATLIASFEQPVEFATIEYVPAGSTNLESFDCAVFDDHSAMTVRNRNARIAVVGTERTILSEDHRRQILTAIHELTRSTGLSPNQIRLAPSLKGDLAASSPPQAADLVAFLRAKGFVR